MLVNASASAFLFHFERIESGAQHEYELVAQHLAGGAQFAAKTVAFPQQPRLAVGAAVAEGRKHQGDHREPVEIRHEIIDVAIVRPDHAGPADPARQRLRIAEKARGRNQDRAAVRKRIVVRDVDERITGDFSALNEWHRPAP